MFGTFLKCCKSQLVCFTALSYLTFRCLCNQLGEFYVHFQHIAIYDTCQAMSFSVMMSLSGTLSVGSRVRLYRTLAAIFTSENDPILGSYV